MIKVSYIQCPTCGVFLQKINLGDGERPMHSDVYGFDRVMVLRLLEDNLHAGPGSFERTIRVIQLRGHTSVVLSAFEGNASDAPRPHLDFTGPIPLGNICLIPNLKAFPS